MLDFISGCIEFFGKFVKMIFELPFYGNVTYGYLLVGIFIVSLILVFLIGKLK